MSRGQLIAVEGIDGSGTTTLVARLCEALSRRGHAVHRTREPSDGPVGRLLREMLAGGHQPVDRITLGLLFAADRADHVQREVMPAIERGELVISDRWYHSSLAYQGPQEALGSGPSGGDAPSGRAWIRALNRHAPAPALTLFVEVSPELAAERRAARGGEAEIFDELSTQRRIAAGYREVIAELRAAGEDIAILDGSKSAGDVLGEALDRVSSLLA